MFARYVNVAERRTALLLGAAALLAVLALAQALRLEVRSDLSELLPDQHPAVQALRRISGRQKSATNLVLLIQSPDAAQGLRFADALRPELERLVPEVFTEIQWRPDTEIPEYAARWRWLYADKRELLQAEELLDRLVARRKSPLVVDLEGDPEAELREWRKRIEQRVPAKNEAPYFKSEEGGQHFVGLMLWRRRDGLGSLGDHQTLRRVKEVVARLQPASFHPQLRVRYTGHIAQAVDEQNGIREDITVATVLCGTLVLLSIYLYFQRFGILLAIGAPAVLGVLLSLALARAAQLALNANTAFLISIILGNGINTPIILLARYGEERRRGRAVAPALATAMDGTFVGTLTAMAAASIAYGCLILTDFRGFSQFGFIGGAGMLLAWATAFMLVPPLLIAGERVRPGIFTPRANLWLGPFARYGRLAARRPLLLGLCALALVLGVAWPLARYVKDPLEWDFRKLRSDATEAESLWGKMEAMGMGNVGAGYIGNDGVLLVDSPDQADAVAEALRRQDAALGSRHVLAEVRTLSSMLPRDQDEKLAILDRIRAKLDRHRDLISEEEWRELEGVRPPAYLRRVTADDLPRQVREAFTEVDGQRGRLIGIDADHANFQYWDGHDLLRLAGSLKVESLGKTWIAASAGTVFAGMVETIHRDGAPITLTALAGVMLLVIVVLGPRGALPVLLSLGVGMAWLVGLMGVLNLKLNFMNFVAIPITLGIGTEYATQIWARLRQENPARPEAVAQVIADTGSAVALCSATTIIGYSSLLLARNQALRSFGLAADLGEVTCLLAALTVLPAVVGLLGRRRAQAARASGAGRELTDREERAAG